MKLKQVIAFVCFSCVSVCDRNDHLCQWRFQMVCHVCVGVCDSLLSRRLDYRVFPRREDENAKGEFRVSESGRQYTRYKYTLLLSFVIHIAMLIIML